LPKTILARIIKAAQGEEEYLYQKDAKSAMSKCATVFVSYLTAVAADMAKNANVKTITTDHVLQGMYECGMEQDTVQHVQRIVEEDRARRATLSKKERSNEHVGVGVGVDEEEVVVVEEGGGALFAEKHRLEEEEHEDEDEAEQLEEQQRPLKSIKIIQLVHSPSNDKVDIDASQV